MVDDEKKCDSRSVSFTRFVCVIFFLLFFALLVETSAGIMCYINQVTHSVGYPRFVFTNNTPYGRPSNNNILVRLDTFCSVRRETTHQSDAK